ncbi:hypothetical protein NQZ68_019182 [Dissostichus eleginoides]|nr:hypothetical protein NQZ68_019182 [Dissostichus eleginoides]
MQVIGRKILLTLTRRTMSPQRRTPPSLYFSHTGGPDACKEKQILKSSQSAGCDRPDTEPVTGQRVQEVSCTGTVHGAEEFIYKRCLSLQKLKVQTEKEALKKRRTG